MHYLRTMAINHLSHPIYVGVGAAKSGSTWWHKLIRDHPEVAAAPKEFKHFVNVIGEDTPRSRVATYAQRFDIESPLIQGEWTPRYMFDPWGMPLLQEAAPDARIIAMLRDPWDRAVSGDAHSSRQKLANEVWMLSDAINRGMYADQVKRIYESFSRDSVLILQYEQAIREPERLLEITYRHLGCKDDAFSPSNMFKRINATPGEKPALPAEVEHAAKRTYRGDAERLVELLPDFDLSLWPSAQ